MAFLLIVIKLKCLKFPLIEELENKLQCNHALNTEHPQHSRVTMIDNVYLYISV